MFSGPKGGQELGHNAVCLADNMEVLPKLPSDAFQLI
jgi:hypothetical protein